MGSESWSEIAIRILYASVSVVIVTAICIYNYLSRTSRRTADGRSRGDVTEKSRYANDTLAEKAITDSPGRRTSFRIPESRESSVEGSPGRVSSVSRISGGRKPAIKEVINESVKSTEKDFSKDALFFEKLAGGDSTRRNSEEKPVLPPVAAPRQKAFESDVISESGSNEKLVRDIIRESFSKKKREVKKTQDEKLEKSVEPSEIHLPEKVSQRQKSSTAKGFDDKICTQKPVDGGDLPKLPRQEAVQEEYATRDLLSEEPTLARTVSESVPESPFRSGSVLSPKSDVLPEDLGIAKAVSESIPENPFRNGSVLSLNSEVLPEDLTISKTVSESFRENPFRNGSVLLSKSLPLDEPVTANTVSESCRENPFRNGSVLPPESDLLLKDITNTCENPFRDGGILPPKSDLEVLEDFVTAETVSESYPEYPFRSGSVSSHESDLRDDINKILYEGKSIVNQINSNYQPYGQITQKESRTESHVHLTAVEAVSDLPVSNALNEIVAKNASAEESPSRSEIKSQTNLAEVETVSKLSVSKLPVSNALNEIFTKIDSMTESPSLAEEPAHPYLGEVEVLSSSPASELSVPEAPTESASTEDASTEESPSEKVKVKTAFQLELEARLKKFKVSNRLTEVKDTPKSSEEVFESVSPESSPSFQPKVSDILGVKLRPVESILESALEEGLDELSALESVVKVIVDESSCVKASSRSESSSKEDSAPDEGGDLGANYVTMRDGLQVSRLGFGLEDGFDLNPRRHSDTGPTETTAPTDIAREISAMKKSYRKSLPAEFMNVLGSGLQAQMARMGGAFSAQNLRDDPNATPGARRRSTESVPQDRVLSQSEVFQREIKSKANMRLTQKNRNILAAHFKDKFAVNNDLFKMIPTTEPVVPTQDKFKVVCKRDGRYQATPRKALLCSDFDWHLTVYKELKGNLVKISDTTVSLAEFYLRQVLTCKSLSHACRWTENGVTSRPEAQEVLRKQLRQPVIPKSVSPTAEIVNGTNGDGESGGGGGGLADRLGKLETAAQGWKKRVGPTDAVQFSVAGRMKGTSAEPNPSLSPLVASPILERKKKVPKPARFKSKTGSTGGNDSSESDESAHSPTTAAPEPSIKTSPTAVNGDINLVKKGALSVSKPNQDHPKVEVPNTYDDSFSSFFSAAPTVEFTPPADVETFDLDDLKIDPSLPKLNQRRNIKVQRRREASRNPVKVLAERKDLKQEYTEVIIGVAETDLRQLNVEKLSKNSNLAVEALAGLASKEDFTAVSLKKPTLQSNAPMLPYKSLMLLLVKGRRHVQTRLVEPTYKSINKGDTFVLVTPNEVYLWLGEFSNVIERSRGVEVATHIAQTKDLGCIGANNVITITDGKPSIHAEKFWTILGASKADANKMEVINAGHLDEDEIYEISLVGTNMIYEVDGDELVPVEKFWGNIPKIEMLDANKILVFDFGTELYVWNGKNASMERRKVASKLAQELWDEGYDYTDCDISPINASLNLGSRSQLPEASGKSGPTRPSFALIGKVTQHMETILFREKFLDWPDFNRVIRTKSQEEDEKQMVANLDLKPCDTTEMENWKQPEPDFILEGSHLGRGTEYFDVETRRFFAIKTTNVSMWRIEEFEGAKLDDSSVGQFFSGDSYIIQWLYTVSVTGRELGGMPSKHNVAGRDRCAYFIWQGRDASLNEQGAAALLTVELDKERGPQVRIIQGHEPPAFWNLFNGSAVVHRGKRSEPKKKNAWRLYMVRGERENEAQLVEVGCNIKNLRSRGSFILLNPQKSVIFVWHGSKSPKITKKCCDFVATNLKSKQPEEFGLATVVSVQEFSEGQESQEFFDGLGGNNRHLYHSLLDSTDTADFSSMKLFHLSSILGVFQADPVISHSGSYLQQDLYSASQPALFLLDTSEELWLWQGWWPVDGDLLDSDDSFVEEAGTGGSQRGAVAIRWQAERRAAMATALNYWKDLHPTDSPKAHLVWAGLEPTEFTNLFPEWIDRDDVAELNIRDGRKPCEILSVERELMRLTKSTYPPEVLLQRPLPEGVDPTRLELYLEPKHFKELLGVTKEEFLELPLWKQTKMKKEACLF